MKYFKRKTWIIIAILFACNLSPAFASGYSPVELSRTSHAASSGRKLGRGISNLLLGWVEVPRGMETVGRESGFTAGATWGVIQGAGSALVRTAAGALEIATFPLPFPSKGDEPPVEPEFIV